MAKLVTDELWAIVEPLLPAPKARRFRYPGRKATPNRVALTAILLVLKTGIPWEDVPEEIGCSGMTAWNRLNVWQQAGLWDKIHLAILQKLQEADKLNWEHGIVVSSSVRATGGGEKTGPNPTDRAKPGTKHHALSEGNGLPLATTVTGANRNDTTQLQPLVKALPEIRNLEMKLGISNNLTTCWLTAPTILKPIGIGCKNAASLLNSPKETRLMAADWANTAGPSNV